MRLASKTYPSLIVSEDPIKDGLNWYSYCGENPILRKDPTGENWISDRLSEAWEATKWGFNVIGNYANKLQKEAQRRFWRTGTKYILQDYFGYETSAWMLEHSLSDNPSDEWRGNNSRIAYLINTDDAYISALDNAINSSSNGKINQYLDGISFNNGDLYYSIHKATIHVEGYRREDGSWIVHATMTDTYDFTEIQSFMNDDGWSTQAGLGTIANDAAVISQRIGAIKPYKITVDFYTTR